MSVECVGPARSDSLYMERIGTLRISQMRNSTHAEFGVLKLSPLLY